MYTSENALVHVHTLHRLLLYIQTVHTVLLYTPSNIHCFCTYTPYMHFYWTCTQCCCILFVYNVHTFLTLLLHLYRSAYGPWPLAENPEMPTTLAVAANDVRWRHMTSYVVISRVSSMAISGLLALWPALSHPLPLHIVAANTFSCKLWIRWEISVS